MKCKHTQHVQGTAIQPVMSKIRGKEYSGGKKKKNLSGNINIEGFISKFLVLTVEPKRSPL